LNYSYRIVCSYFFKKIIFRYTSCYFIRDPLSVLQDSTPTDRRLCPSSCMHFQTCITNSKKIKKMENLCTTSFYVTYSLYKILNLEYCKYYKKIFTKQSYHERRFMTFNPNDQCHENEHNIVCSNDTIFRIIVRLGMANNIVEGSFHFLWMKNSFSNFRVPYIVFFVKQPPKLTLRIGPTQSWKIIDHFQCTFHL
jgi:hypothetical protein